MIKNRLKNKKIILFTVTKDTINFLDMYNKNNPEFEIVGICDITLKYRKNIDKILKKSSGDIEIFYSLSDFNKFKGYDTIIKFDHYIHEERLVNQIEMYDSKYFNSTLFEEKIKEKYEMYVNKQKGTEFTFVINIKHQIILNSYIVNKNVNIIQIYGDGILCSLDKSSPFSEDEQKERFKNSVIKFDYNAIDFLEKRHDINIYDITRKQTPKLHKPIFVISSDFGGGKTKYTMSKDVDYLSGDLYVAFFDENSYYGSGRIENKKELTSQIMDSLVRRTHYGKSGEVYVRIEGDINSWIFTHIQGDWLRSKWNDFHHYFDDYEFHIVVPETDDKEKFIKKVNLFKTIHHVDDDKIKIILSINHASEFKELTLSKYIGGKNGKISSK